MIKIGDYYNSELEQTENKILIKESESGYEEQYFRKEDIKFKVLDIKNNGEILLISEKPIKQKVYLKGELGYKNSKDILDRLSKEITGIENARSMTFEDIIESKYWEDNEKKKLIWGEDDNFQYWLGSSYVTANSSGAFWGVRFVGNGYVGSCDFVSSAGYHYDDKDWLRPVVYIKQEDK